MRTYMVIPSYWSGPDGSWEQGDAIYDHPTPVNRKGTLGRTLESIHNLNHKDFTLIILGAVTNQIYEKAMRDNLIQIIREANLPVDTILFTDTSLNNLKEVFYKDLDAPDILQLRGYSNIRNMCLFLPYILDAEVAILIDDDEVFEDPDFLLKSREFIGKRYYGNMIDGVAGYYLNEDNQYYDKVSIVPWMTYWDRFGHKREAFDKIIGSDPRLKRTPFAFGGAMVIHRNLMRTVPFDPLMTRGEDTDYVISSRIFGFNFYLDNQLSIKHLPPKKNHPVWRRFREDIYRFLYNKSKFDNQKPHKNLHMVKASDFDPYPGEFMKDDLEDKIFKTNIMLALDYLSDGKIEQAKETIRNIYVAKYDAVPHYDTFDRYLEFQKTWRKHLEHTKLFGSILKNLITMEKIVSHDTFEREKKTFFEDGGLDDDFAIENIELFNDFTKKEIRKFLKIRNIEKYSKGDTIFNCGEVNDAVYIILDGVVQLFKNKGDNEPVLMVEMFRGEHFNETSIFVSGERNVTVTAKTDAVLMKIDKKELLDIFDKDKTLASKVLWKLAKKLGSRLTETTSLYAKSRKQDLDVSDTM